MRLIDITTPLESGLKVWPGDTPPSLTGERSENGYLTGTLTTTLHAGSHLDAPLHACKGGADVASLPLEVLIGSCSVAECITDSQITLEVVQTLGIEQGCERLLLKTRTSTVRDIDTPYAVLTPEAAEYLVGLGLRLIGIDTPSVGLAGDEGYKVHRTFLDRGIIIVEWLQLGNVVPGEYELICLPLNLPGADGSPVRAVLRTTLP